ncbi:MAG TPA: hypothetical protein VN689_10790, partial [Burkholderiales bacterium]|nr:hypothetical protein [Burkholderiales bacterium]
MPKRVVLSGATGRMGQALVALIQSDPELEAAGGLDVHARSGDEAKKFGVPVIAAIDDAGELIAQADVVIDFSAAAGTQSLLQKYGGALAGKALVIGTTGLTDDSNTLIAEVAKRAPVIVSANYSIGV